MARWLYGFREEGRRECGVDEVATFQRHYRRARGLAVALGLGAVLLFLGVVGSIAVAVERPALGWSLLVLFLVAGIAIFSFASSRDRLALHFRRAARLGWTRQWRRVEPSDAVRAAYARFADDEEGLALDRSPFWSLDEAFDRRLASAAGATVSQFETAGDDGGVLLAEGRMLHRLIEGRIVNVPEGTHAE